MEWFAFLCSMKNLLLLPLLLFAACTTNEPKTASDSVKTDTTKTAPPFDPMVMHDGIANLEQLRCGLILRGSYDSLVALYAEGARLCPEKGTFITGPTEIAGYFKNEKGTFSLARNTISVSGTPDLLYEIGIETGMASGTDTHNRMSWNYKYLTVWKRNADDSWQIAAEMWNELKEEK